MKSGSGGEHRMEKGGRQTWRGKQDIASPACFDSSSQASQILVFSPSVLQSSLYTYLFSTNCMPDIRLGRWKGHAWGSHPSVCVRACVCVCVCVHAHVHACWEYLRSPIPVLLHGMFDHMDACPLWFLGSCILRLFPFPTWVFLILYSCLFLIYLVSKQTKLPFF